MILNPSFEKDWGTQSSHAVLICRPGQPPVFNEIGNIFTPPDWLTWYQHDETYAQPEVRDAWKTNDPRRVRSGEKGILFFTFYRKHFGGLLQQVEAEPGQRLRFTIWAHAWSNTKGDGFPHPDDGRWSEGAGYQEVSWEEGTQPHDTGDPQQDAKANFSFTVGIDPTGGVNPLADTVIWGITWHTYNGYVKQLSVEATALTDKITVFVRSKTLWPFKHNDAYFDDAELVVVDPVPPPPPSYKSTMLVLPQGASVERLHEILAKAYPNRRTFGFSHDDAGHLDGTAILYDIAEPDKQAYLDYYAERYPSVVVEFASANEESLLWQCDPRWKDEKLADPSCSKTLCQIGCWISDCAMAQRYFGIKPDATPSTANQALGAEGGFSGCLTTWNGMKVALGLEVVKRTTDNVEAQEWLDRGYVCFAEVEPNDYMHFVLVTGYKEGRFWMLDPYKNQKGWLDEHYRIESWRLIRPLTSSPPPPPPPSGTLVSLHLQTMVPGALEYVRAAKPRVIKIFQLENAKAIKAANPNTLVVLRYYTQNQNVSGDLARRAREYVATFEDSLRVNADWIDYVESYNEIIPSGNPEVTKRSVEFDCCFADALAALGLPVKPILLNVPVGNPFEDEVELLLPAVRKVVQYGGAIGYHGYGLAVAPSGNLNDNWQHYAGRALVGWDPTFTARGLYPDYILGEAGAFASCGDGWRSSKCLGGDWNRYLDQLKEFQERLQVWNSQHGYRCLGAVLFTSGGFGWDNFEIYEAEMESMAAEL